MKDANIVMSFVIYFISFQNHFLLGRRLNGINLAICQAECTAFQFSCNCERSDWEALQLPQFCIPRTWQCDGWKDCPDGSDEIDCHCKEGLLQCGCESGGNCFSNSIYECIDPAAGYCLSRRGVNTSCDDPRNRCDGNIDCPWLLMHDEMNCTSCPKNKPNRCECNKENSTTCTGEGSTCYQERGRCDQLPQCSDASDEKGCPCGDDQFTCECYKKDPVECSSNWGCIPLSKYNDGVKDCADGSDETPFDKVVTCGACDVTMKRLRSVSECNETELCDVATCFSVPSLQCETTDCALNDVICTSSSCEESTPESCKGAFQCSRGELALLSHFCNNEMDCLDGSDEVRNEPGFKCSGQAGTCVLPQRNLYDDVAHCRDQSDLCFDGVHTCFRCLDNRLVISAKQRCDDVIDCYDLSDECLCDNTTALDARCSDMLPTYSSISLPIALNRNDGTRFTNDDITPNHTSFQNPKVPSVRCDTKWGVRTAVLCDGRPECKDFMDECSCDNPPSFCNDSCHSYHPLGDRYCDGHEDESWVYINDTSCPLGFDEMLCPKRYRCRSGERVSIDVKEICDGIPNCDDGSDERNCSYLHHMSPETTTPEGGASGSLRATSFHLLILVLYSIVFVVQ